MARILTPDDSQILTHRFQRLARLLICVVPRVLRNLFNVYHPSSIDCCLSLDMIWYSTFFRELRNSSALQMFWHFLHTREKYSTSESDFTIFKLIREKCGLNPPPTGWNALPNEDDLSLSADIARIKWYRNEIYTLEREKEAKLTEEEYDCFKNKIVSSLTRIVKDYSGTDFEAVKAWEKGVSESLSSPVTEEDEINVEKLKAWYLKDVEEEQKQFSVTEQWDNAPKEEEAKGKKQFPGTNGCPEHETEKLVQSSKNEFTKQWGTAIREKNAKVIEKKGDVEEITLNPRPLEYEVLLIIIINPIITEPGNSVLQKKLGGNGHRITVKTHGLSEYHYAQGIKNVVSGNYIDALTNFDRVLKSTPHEEAFLRASLENNIGYLYFLGTQIDNAMIMLNRAMQHLNCVTQMFENDSSLIEKANSIKFTIKSNYACIQLHNGNFEEALSTFNDLYEKEKKSLKYFKVEEGNLSNEDGEELQECCLFYSPQNSAPKVNLVIAVMNYSEACLASGKLDNIVGVLEDVICCYHFSDQEYLKMVVSARLARIFTVLGERKQAEELVDLQDIDSLKVRKLIESDLLKPFTVIYTDDICRMLSYNGERSKSKELLETAVQVLQEMHFKQHPQVMSLEKTKEELFPTLVIEKTSLAFGEDDISWLKVATIVKYALKFLSNERDRYSLLSEPNALKSTYSDEKSFADMYASEKQLASSTQSPTVAFIRTIRFGASLSQQVKSNSEAETYLRNQLAEIESSCDDLNGNAVSNSAISFLSDYESCCISALCSLLETALLRHAHTSVDDICRSLASCLSRGHNEDVNDAEWYKDFFGLLSYFVATNHVEISGKKIPLYVIVASGSGLKTPDDVDNLPEKKPLFKRIALDADAESQGSSSSYMPGANAKCFVFLRSHDLIDINDLRRINQTIIQSAQSLESLPNIARYQRSLFIEVGPEIDQTNVSGLCLQLNSLKCCLEGFDADCHSPVNEPSLQNLYLQKLQKVLTFDNESDLDVFTVLFQYTFSKLGVDVLQKTRKKMVCFLKEPPFSLLTLHTKANNVYLTLQDASDKYSRDDIAAYGITQLVDNTVRDCFKKLGISSINDPQDAWRKLSDEQLNEDPIFCVKEAEEELQKAVEKVDRLTAELEYLKIREHIPQGEGDANRPHKGKISYFLTYNIEMEENEDLNFPKLCPKKIL